MKSDESKTGFGFSISNGITTVLATVLTKVNFAQKRAHSVLKQELISYNSLGYIQGGPKK